MELYGPLDSTLKIVHNSFNIDKEHYIPLEDKSMILFLQKPKHRKLKKCQFKILNQTEVTDLS